MPEKSMHFEAERRYLLPLPPVLDGTARKNHIVQGYLDLSPQNTERVRIKNDTDAFFTVKGPRRGGVGTEQETRIPLDEAQSLLQRCDPAHIIHKTRYEWSAADGHLWEIDIFHEKLEGLVIAEVELPDIHARFVKPRWLNGPDITHDNRLSNSSLVQMERQTLLLVMQAWMNTHNGVHHTHK